jgi:hypothetical protein
VLLLGLSGAGCETRDETAARPGSADTSRAAESRCVFVDVTGAWGIDFRHHNDASAERLFPETMGSGVALFDADGDGRLDVFLVNGTPLDAAAAPRPTHALYRNAGAGRFEDVTLGSGLDVAFFGMGAAIGDIDNDGRTDLLVTAVGRARIFRNLGGCIFADATDELGLDAPGFSSSAAFLDYDRDGFLDLFICRYVEWSRETDLACLPDGIHRVYCTPERYPPVTNMLFRNQGGRKLVDVTAETGIGALSGKALGVVVFDHDRDGWSDIAVANDTVRNFLFRNRGNGTFAEIGIETGIAYSESGAPRGAMGIDAGDVDGDGRADLVVANFAHEMSAFFRASASLHYVDDAAHAGLGFPTLSTLGFGILLEDLDGNGFLDVLVANGHIEPEIARVQRGQSYAQRPQLFLNDGARLLEVSGGAGALTEPLVGRGLAAADLDQDGDPDVVVTQNGGPAKVYRNDTPARWLHVGVEGTASNRSGWGARVTLHLGEERVSREIVAGRSYLSATEPFASFGLGADTEPDSLVVDWPSGLRQVVTALAGLRVHVRELPAPVGDSKGARQEP